MKKLYIIPDRNNIHESIEIAKKYNAGFEFNDFYSPDILDDADELNRRLRLYLSNRQLPEKRTMHGAFYDVLIFSSDRRIRKISEYRIDQSLEVANLIGASSVIFHTNYLPTFYLESYRKTWIDMNTYFWAEQCVKHPELNIYIENMFDISPELLYKLAKSLESIPNFGVCFDYAHASLARLPLEEWSSQLSSYVRHLHINDNDLKSDLHLAVGDGKIDWKLFSEQYKKYFSECSLLIETTGIDKISRSIDFIQHLNL
jgi:sugar phosphate isomerase/epimerase